MDRLLRTVESSSRHQMDDECQYFFFFCLFWWGNILFYHEGQMSFSQIHHSSSNVKFSFGNFGEEPGMEEEMPPMFAESQTESLDEVELHDLNWFYRMRMPNFNRNLLFLNILYKVNFIKFYIRPFSFSLLGEKKVWPSWLEYLLWI